MSNAPNKILKATRNRRYHSVKIIIDNHFYVQCQVDVIDFS